jgi:hypothetical protein
MVVAKKDELKVAREWKAGAPLEFGKSLSIPYEKKHLFTASEITDILIVRQGTASATHIRSIIEARISPKIRTINSFFQHAAKESKYSNKKSIITCFKVQQIRQPFQRSKGSDQPLI